MTDYFNFFYQKIQKSHSFYDFFMKLWMIYKNKFSKNK